LPAKRFAVFIFRSNVSIFKAAKIVGTAEKKAVVNLDQPVFLLVQGVNPGNLRIYQ
jgi:hypothetical protein